MMYTRCMLILSALVLAGAANALTKEDPRSGDVSVIPWRLEVPEAQLNDLRSRLQASIMPTELEDVTDWSYGTPKSFVSKMRDYWLEKYDWRSREAYINSALKDQFMTEVEGLKLHFVHVKSANESAVPLIVSHGWPGSVLECAKIIPLLTSRFHIVCPSIPGYFFSEHPTQKGFDTQQVAKHYSLLMARLGYKNYIAQGGDWGSEISRWLGINDRNCVGIHISLVVHQFPRPTNGLWGFTEFLRTGFEILFSYFTDVELAHLERTKQYTMKESAYMMYHSTFPQSIAYALSDSPLGLAAYLWEKYYNWADLKDNTTLLGTFTEDELIDFVTIYWFSNSIASSIRLYKETIPGMFTTEIPFQPKPTAVAAFKDIVVVPQRWASTIYRVVRWTEMPYGGHFAALEAPELLSNDVIQFSEMITNFLVNGYSTPKPRPSLESWTENEFNEEL